ncbi:MAG TPA: hypothetical protein VI483_03215 [Candidatus Paceibacterota bacterium]
MTQYLLVGASHELTDGISDRLLSPECLARFKSEIAPRVTNDSLILREGFSSRGIVRPDHRAYRVTLRDFGDAFGNTTPALIAVDPRDTTSITKSDSMGAKYDRWEVLARQIIETDWARKPTTFLEALEWLKREPPLARLTRRLTREEIELARWVRTQHRKFDFQYSDAMRRYGPQFDFCVFVGGTIHALALAKRTGYPATYLGDECEVGEVYLAYLAEYVWISFFH